MNIYDMPDVMTVKQLSEYLPLGKSSIYGLLIRGKIKSIRQGRKYLIPKIYILDYLGVIGYNNSTHITIEPINTKSFIEREVEQ